MKLTKLIGLVSLIVLLVSAVGSAIAKPSNLLDRAHLESFSDGVMYTSMRNHNVAGAVLSVVADGELLFSKGYGFSDVEKQLPVDPEKTLFRIASITKLLTWVAVMQLHEQGRLNLDTDINQYLEGITIPDTFDDPITIRHLMSHTPGFEDHVVRLFSRNKLDMRPYLEILNEEEPKRVRPAGDLASYSNHGTALAALIVEQVSGEDWADYVESNILEPLAMNFTSIRQPLPNALAPHLSQGYRWKQGRYLVEPFEFVPLAPIGGGSSSAIDLSRFMLAFLNGGELDGDRILKPATAALMQQSLYRSDPRLSAILHGFYESNRNGHRIYGHGGDTIWFHSELMLLPESGVGVFISTNTDKGGLVRRDYIDAFLERFYPYAGKTNQADFVSTDVSAVVGDYASLRTSFTDFTKLGQLISGVKVTASDDGQLKVLGFGEPQYFVEIDKGQFRRVGRDQTIAFRFDEQGRASHLLLNYAPVITFDRVSPLYSPAAQISLLVFCGVVFLWVLLAWPVQHLSSRWNMPLGLTRFRQIGWLLALLFFALVFGLAMAMKEPVEVVFGLSTAIKLLLFANLLMPFVTLLLISQLPSLFRETGVPLSSRVLHIAVVFAGVGYSWFLYTWRMFSY